jgi:ABC-2 type transport system ATP-binding protein
MLRTGVVPEEPDAPPAMTAAELERFLARHYPRWDGAGFHARLGRFGVPPKVPFGRLSKGQKAQVMFGLAVAPTPELLVLDDPTLGLDVVARNALFEELIGDLADRGTSVFLTSHDLAGVERIASRVGILRDGRLLVDDELDALKARVRLLRYRREAPAADELAGFEVVTRGDGPLGASAVVSNYSDERFAAFVARAGIREAKPTTLSLEEIFTALTSEKGASA